MKLIPQDNHDNQLDEAPLSFDWKVAKGHWRPWGTNSAVLGCPGCGFVASLVNHKILDDGTVVPSVDCPECDYHEFIKLDSWNK